MKVSDVMQERQKAIIIDKLHNIGFYDTDDKPYPELKRILAIESFKQINVETSANNWF